MIIVELVTWDVGVTLSALVGCWVYAVAELTFIALGWKDVEL